MTFKSPTMYKNLYTDTYIGFPYFVYIFHTNCISEPNKAFCSFTLSNTSSSLIYKLNIYTCPYKVISTHRWLKNGQPQLLGYEPMGCFNLQL